MGMKLPALIRGGLDEVKLGLYVDADSAPVTEEELDGVHVDDGVVDEGCPLAWLERADGSATLVGGNWFG